MISKNLWYLSHMISYIFYVIMSPGEIFKLKLEISSWKIFKLKLENFLLFPSWNLKIFKLVWSLNLKISSCFQAETWDFQAETWNFKLELEISRWKVLDLMFLDGSPYVLVLIARSTFKLGLVGASSGSQVPFSRVCHSRQAAGWLPVTVSLSQHLKYKSVRLVRKGHY